MVATRAVWTAVAISASLNWMAWCCARGAPEGFPQLGVAHRFLKGGLADAYALGGNGNPAGIQNVHSVAEPHAGFADEVGGGDFGVLKDHFAGAGGADAHFVVLGVDLHPPGCRRGR